MDDSELRDLIVETASDMPHSGGLSDAAVACAVLDRMCLEQRMAAVGLVFERYVQDTMDDALKARLS